MTREEAIEKLRGWYFLDNDEREVLETLIPEIRVSKDEKIRRELIEHIKSNCATNFALFQKFSPDDVIAWLEKQGEQKRTDKVEPKFKVGDKVYSPRNRFECTIESIDETTYYCDTTNFDIKDQDNWKLVEQNSTNKVELKFNVGDWITFYGDKPFKILKVESEQNGILDYLLLSQNGHDSYYNKKYVDENARLWTIQDAKDGDVLVEDSCIFIIQKLGDNNTAAKTYYTLYDDGDFDNGSILYFDIDSTKPATKEQRDLLFQKMKEAGYEWNEEKKELKKIEKQDEQKDINPTLIEKEKMDDAFTKMMLKGKTKWTEEDECYMGECISAVATKDGWSFEEKRKTKHWLKSLKQRM